MEQAPAGSSPKGVEQQALLDWEDAVPASLPGYEVRFNLSPVVRRPGWQRDWTDLLVRMADVLPGRVKEQATAEIIMLTHNQQLHEVNLG